MSRSFRYTGQYEIMQGRFLRPREGVGALRLVARRHGCVHERDDYEMTGGEVNVGGYCAPGRYATGIGSMLIHGGQFTHRLSSGGAFNAGEEGTGYVSVANGGVLEVADNDGVVLASSWSSGARGMVRLSPGGLLKAKRIKGGQHLFLRVQRRNL